MAPRDNLIASLWGLTFCLSSCGMPQATGIAASAPVYPSYDNYLARVNLVHNNVGLVLDQVPVGTYLEAVAASAGHPRTASLTGAADQLDQTFGSLSSLMTTAHVTTAVASSGEYERVVAWLKTPHPTATATTLAELAKTLVYLLPVRGSADSGLALVDSSASASKAPCTQETTPESSNPSFSDWLAAESSKPNYKFHFGPPTDGGANEANLASVAKTAGQSGLDVHSHIIDIPEPDLPTDSSWQKFKSGCTIF